MNEQIMTLISGNMIIIGIILLLSGIFKEVEWTDTNLRMSDFFDFNKIWLGISLLGIGMLIFIKY